MYLWNSGKLVNDLRDNAVSEKEKLKYVLFWVVATMIVSDPLLHFDYEYVLNDAILSAVMLIVSIAGTIYCYKVNKNGDNKDFLTRYICLSIPVGIRAFVIIIAILAFITAIELSLDMSVIGEGEEVTTTIYEVIVFSLFMLGIYYYLARCIRSASARSV